MERAYNAAYDTLGNIMEMCDEAIKNDKMDENQLRALLKVFKSTTVYARQYMFNEREREKEKEQ